MLEGAEKLTASASDVISIQEELMTNMKQYCANKPTDSEKGQRSEREPSCHPELSGSPHCHSVSRIFRI